MEYLPAVRSFLLQPYPFSENLARKLAICSGVGLFITLFLIGFRPFGFDELPLTTQWRHALLFGLVTFAVSAFFQAVLPRVLPRLFREEGWRSWKEILYLLVTTAAIGGANYGLIQVLYPQNASLAGFLRAQLITFEVGVFPILFVVFLKQLTLYRRFAGEAKEVSEDIHTEIALAVVQSKEEIQQAVTLKGDNQKEELVLSPGDLFFIASADNYVRVQFRQSGVQKSVLLRSTLKKMEEQLAPYPVFFRCHRMYLVNLHLVTEVSGNAQGLKLHLLGIEEPVPVSRSLTETVKSRLHDLTRSPQKA